MSDWIVLSRSAHAAAGYRPRERYGFTDRETTAAVLLAELGMLLPHYVLAFLAREDAPLPVALLSVDGRTNHYLHPDGRWLARYVPACFRGFPFALATIEGGQGTLCIRQEHLAETGGEAIFEEDGTLAAPVAQLFDFLGKCEADRARTRAAATALAEAGVLEPWPLRIERGEGEEPLGLGGLLRVSEARLNALEGGVYASIRGAPMALAHAQLFSMLQVQNLVARARLPRGEAMEPAFQTENDLWGAEDVLLFNS